MSAKLVATAYFASCLEEIVIPKERRPLIIVDQHPSKINSATVSTTDVLTTKATDN